MKNKFITVILFIIMIILLGGLIFFAYAIYTDFLNSDVVETIHTSESNISVDKATSQTNNTKKSVGETITSFFTVTPATEKTYSDNSSAGKYFYEQLSKNQKSIYNGLQENKENLVTGKYKIEFGNKFKDILSQENGDKTLGDDFQTAIEAFTHDNPDLFYIDVTKMYLNMETKKKVFSTTYNVFIAPEEGKDYFTNGFKSMEEVRIAQLQINQKKNIVKSKLTGNTYKDIKIIHDYLIDNLQYDENNESKSPYSIYGALVEQKCVCEGYTRAFKYLADMAGIKCVLMQGSATNRDNMTEKHAWNAVYLNNKWYLIDATWDDPIIVGRGIVLGNVHYKYFLKGSKTFNKDHVLEYQFTEGGKKFSYPKISENDY